MAKFFNVGYYNAVDAVMMADYSADKIVSTMELGFGAFHHSDSDSYDEETDKKLLSKNGSAITSDGEYIVVFDVSGRFDDCPLDLLEDNARDEFIDVWKKVND